MCLRSLVACVNCDGTLLSTCMKTGSLRSSMPVGQLLDLIWYFHTYGGEISSPPATERHAYAPLHTSVRTSVRGVRGGLRRVDRYI